MTLSLGAHIGQQNLTMDEMRALWRRLDDSGMDWLSAWDHIYEAPAAGGVIPHFEAIATLAALAVETKHARLGCLVFYVGYRNPGLLAKAAITIDHLSGGRFELGLGGGWHRQEALAYGYDFPRLGTRLDMLEEATTLIRSLFTQARTTFKGEHYSATDASCLPAPVRGDMPIWIGGVGEKRTLPIAAAKANGWNAAYVSAPEFARLSKVLDEACEKIDRDPASIERSINLTFNMGVDDKSAQLLEAEMDLQWGSAVDRIKGGALIGTPERAIERILEYREAGADLVNIALRYPLADESLEAYLSEVVPAVRKESSTSPK